jgi:hypothetical protein
VLLWTVATACGPPLHDERTLTPGTKTPTHQLWFDTYVRASVCVDAPTSIAFSADLARTCHRRFLKEQYVSTKDICEKRYTYQLPERRFPVPPRHSRARCTVEGAAEGVETYRQISPQHLLQLARIRRRRHGSHAHPPSFLHPHLVSALDADLSPLSITSPHANAKPRLSATRLFPSKRLALFIFCSAPPKYPPAEQWKNNSSITLFCTHEVNRRKQERNEGKCYLPPYCHRIQVRGKRAIPASKLS